MSTTRKKSSPVKTDDEEVSGPKTTKLKASTPNKKDKKDQKEQRDHMSEQIKKLDEKIYFHKDKLETLQAKKVILDNKFKKL